jgi:hypothetical protein
MGVPEIILAIVAAGLVATVAVRWSNKKNAPSPPAPESPVPLPPPAPLPPETEHEQLIRAILILDTNAAERMSSLKIFLFWLPFIWGAIYAILYWIVLSLR